MTPATDITMVRNFDTCDPNLVFDEETGERVEMFRAAPKLDIAAPTVRAALVWLGEEWSWTDADAVWIGPAGVSFYDDYDCNCGDLHVVPWAWLRAVRYSDGTISGPNDFTPLGADS